MESATPEHELDSTITPLRARIGTDGNSSRACEETARFPEDGLLGAGAVEIALTRLLIGERSNPR